MNQSVARFNLFTGFYHLISDLLDKVMADKEAGKEPSQELVDWLEAQFTRLMETYDSERDTELSNE